MIVGAWRWPQYEAAFTRGLEYNGVEVVPFVTAHYFNGQLGHYQLAVPLPGPAIMRLNMELLKDVKKKSPDLILFWRPTHILPSTLRYLTAKGVRIVSYNNDDPFGSRLHGNAPWHHYLLWYWYLRCLPKFDQNYFYRRVNCEESLGYGARHAKVLLPYFMPWQDKPIILSHEDRKIFDTDLVFVGHHEPDGREHSIRALIQAGIKVKVWGGTYWSHKVLGDIYEQLQPIIPVEGDQYTKALCGAKVCLAFLSKLNRDTYTRRCFEIPACGKVMLAERTSDLLGMFKEDEEACFFSSNDELVIKAQWLLNNPSSRERIAAAGLKRVWAEGHDVNNRAHQFLQALKAN